MTASPTKPLPRRRRWPLIVGGLFVLLVVFSGVGFVTASTLEDRDTFCISCHTAPETTYYNHAYIALDNPTLPVTDLASAHYLLSKQHNKEPFACIQCHRGDSSLGHRVAAITLGARDSVIYVVGQENPTLEKTETREGWLSNAACVSCHSDYLLTVKGLDNHFHTKLPQTADVLAKGGKVTVSDALKNNPEAAKEWLAPVSGVTLTCTSCHLAHTTLQNGMSNFFMDSQHRNEACVSCHKVAKKGPQDATTLGN